MKNFNLDVAHLRLSASSEITNGSLSFGFSKFPADFSLNFRNAENIPAS